MSLHRVILALLAVLLLPSLALAQPVPGPARTTFTVNKTFEDGNSNLDVTVHIQCFTGLPLNQSQTVTPVNGEFEVKFVVTEFAQGELDCEIWEDPVPGYSATYTTFSEFGEYVDVPSTEGCAISNIDTSNATEEDPQNSCDIVNSPAPVEIEVNKVWVIEGTSADQLDASYKLRLDCEDEIIGGAEIYGEWRKTLFDGENSSDAAYSAEVIPNWEGGTNCEVIETVYDSAVEVSNNCDNLFVQIGDGDSCTITNSVFYEGIPTLSQYGMAIMALLMLGVGFVGFRRFV